MCIMKAPDDCSQSYKTSADETGSSHWPLEKQMSGAHCVGIHGNKESEEGTTLKYHTADKTTRRRTVKVDSMVAC